MLDQGLYRVDNRSHEASIAKRDQLERDINLSRENNNGAIALPVLDDICIWGFGQQFPLRDPKEVMRITKEAFDFVDKGDLYNGILKLIDNIEGVNISRASKIIGLSDQNDLCIYDSRVGHALRTLRIGSIQLKLIKCPADKGGKRDRDSATNKGWATHYERLLWTIGVMRNYFRTINRPLRAADIEMALYIIGKD